MKRLLVSPDTVMLILNGATSITVSDFQDEEFPVGSEVIICNTETGEDIATAIVSKNMHMKKSFDPLEIESTVDDQEDITLTRIKLI